MFKGIRGYSYDYYGSSYDYFGLSEGIANDPSKSPKYSLEDNQKYIFNKFIAKRNSKRLAKD